MARCSACGEPGFTENELVGGRCPKCRSSSQARPVRSGRTIPVTTETMVPEVTERLGVVTGQCALGMNIFRDFTSEIRDVIGGRSGAYQKAIKEAKDLCISEMKQEAYQLGADAVIAMDLDFSEITGGGGLFGGKGMIMVVATGTAVKWPEPQ